MEIPDEPASSLISPSRVQSRFHAAYLLHQTKGLLIDEIGSLHRLFMGPDAETQKHTLWQPQNNSLLRDDLDPMDRVEARLRDRIHRRHPR
jgi:hypothetical protein